MSELLVCMKGGKRHRAVRRAHVCIRGVPGGVGLNLEWDVMDGMACALVWLERELEVSEDGVHTCGGRGEGRRLHGVYYVERVRHLRQSCVA